MYWWKFRIQRVERLAYSALIWSDLSLKYCHCVGRSSAPRTSGCSPIPDKTLNAHLLSATAWKWVAELSLIVTLEMPCARAWTRAEARPRRGRESEVVWEEPN